MSLTLGTTTHATILLLAVAFLAVITKYFALLVAVINGILI